MKPIKDKHIIALTESKKSGINIGSRALGHRLTQDEKKRIEIAKKR